MDSFIEALLSEKTDKIPDEYVCEIIGRKVKL